MLTRDRSTLAGTLMIVSGIFTVLASAGAFFGLIWICVGAFWLIPLVIGIGEIAVGAAIMGGTPHPRVRAMSAFGILAALLCGNLIGVAMEIGALVLVSRSEPKGLLS